MRRSDEEILNRWLAAEEDGQEELADEALAALFQAMPPLAPPAGFADRVLVRAGLTAPVPRRQRIFAARWVRVLAMLPLLIVGLTLPWLSEVLRSLASLAGFLWSPGDLVRLGTGSLVALSQALVAALALWDWLLGIGRTLAAPFATPAVALLMIGCLLVSLVAFHFLRNLMTRDRSWAYVESI